LFRVERVLSCLRIGGFVGWIFRCHINVTLQLEGNDVL
jgi:hypothetical protein